MLAPDPLAPVLASIGRTERACTIHVFRNGGNGSAGPGAVGAGFDGVSSLPGRQFVTGHYGAGTWLVDFSKASSSTDGVREDPRSTWGNALGWNVMPGAETWSAKEYKGYVYTGDMTRGFDVFSLTTCEGAGCLIRPTNTPGRAKGNGGVDDEPAELSILSGPSKGGTATFSLDVAYLPGQAAPAGKLTFHDKSAGRKVTATGIDSLTIAGAKASDHRPRHGRRRARRLVLRRGRGPRLRRGRVPDRPRRRLRRRRRPAQGEGRRHRRHPDSVTTDEGKRMKKAGIAALAAVVLAGLAGAVPTASSSTDLAQSQRYLVVLAGVQGDQGFAATGTAAAVNAAVAAAGGTVANDLSKQIGVLVVESSAASFASALSSSALVATVGKDKKLKGLPDGGPEQTADPLEPLQWDMEQIRAPQAHDFQAGSRSVDVGILDSGIDGQHPDFVVDGTGSNVDCARGRNSVSFLPSGPGVGTPDPVRRQPVPRHARRRHRRRAGERDRRRRRRPERDARAGEGLRRERLLLRQRRRRRASPTPATSSST